MNFPNGKRAAISFTFDDGSRSQVEAALPVFEEFGFKATFFVIAGLTRERRGDPPRAGCDRPWWAEVSWEEWREVARRGHEIGNHSMTHPAGGLARIRDPLALKAEIEESARLIAGKLGRPPESFAFPFNRSSARVRALALQSHQAARDARLRYGGWRFSVEKANRWVERALRKRAWLVPAIHGVGGGFEPIAADDVRRHLAYIKEREELIWVDTFGAISRHVMGR